MGGFSLDAADAMGGRPGSHAGLGVVSVLSSLVESSLVRPTTGLDEAVRFGMLETIREFGLERLDAAGERASTQDAHAAFFVAFAERLHPNRVEPGERIDDRLARIESEHPNLQVALDHLAVTGDVEGVVRLAGALAVFWHLRGHLDEGRRWLEWALTRAPDRSTAERSRALTGLSLILWSQGDHEAAEPFAHAGLAIARQIGDGDLVAGAVYLLGLGALVRGRWEMAEDLMQEALERWRGLGRRSEEGMALTVLAGAAQGRGQDRAGCRPRHAGARRSSARWAMCPASSTRCVDSER